MPFAVLLTILKKNYTKEIPGVIGDIRIKSPIAVLRGNPKDLIDLCERKGILLGKMINLL